MQKIYTFIFALIFIASSLQAQTVWDNFEDSRNGTYGFINGTFIPYTENPDQNGNTSQVAASYTRNAGELFDVIILDAAMADLSDYLSGAKQMSMDVWSPNAGTTVQITLENSVLAEPANFPTGRHSAYLATTTVANGWETLTFNFDNQPDPGVANDNVDRMVILFAPNTNTGDSYFWDNLNGPELANDPCDGVSADPDTFNDFECNQNVNFVFSHAGVNFRRVLNPDQNGNTSDYVASYVRNGGEEYDVIIGNFDGNLPVQSNSKILFDVWDPNAPTDVIVSLQNANNDVILEMTATTSTSNAWETLIYDPSPVSAAMDISRFVILFDPANFTADQYYFDNFGFGDPLAVEDLEEVVSFEAFPNPSQGLTTFKYDLETSANVNLSIYDMTGKMVAEIVDANQASGSHQATWSANQNPDGMYFYTLSVDGQTASGKIILNK
jgi:hypothetical protein